MTNEVPGAPAGFRPYEGGKLEALRELSEEKDQASKEWGALGGHPRKSWFPGAKGLIESSSGSSFFEKQLHPEVGGYLWYRGFRLVLDVGKEMIIYTPWVHPQETRVPLVLVRGDIPVEVQDQMVESFVSNASRAIKKSVRQAILAREEMAKRGL